MTYFLDSSALVKRYLSEPGSDLVRALFRKRSRRLAVSRIAYAEVVAAVARAWRERLVDDVARDKILDRIEKDFGTLEVIEVRRMIIERIPTLVLRQPLRAYDAVQLASALTLKERGGSVDFWGDDGRLITAARKEGLRATLVGTG
ncbi:MAG: type II toxin-antitoxin system VapC family toxin [Candidatus Binatia bacterium]